MGRGALPTDGFLSSVHWSIAESGVSDPEVAADPAPSIALFTESDEGTMEIWPHSFEAMYTVHLSSISSVGVCDGSLLLYMADGSIA